MRRGIGLFHHRRVLLGQLVHAVDGHVDFLDSDGLFAHRLGNRADVFVNIVDLAANGVQRLTGAVDEGNALSHVLRRLVDQCANLLGGGSRPLGQFANFLCDDRKALARLTSACGLDAGIQRQKVGLERDFIDHADDLRDLLR